VVGQSTALATSGDGSVYTTTVAFTTTLQPGSVVTAPSVASTSSSSTNIGAIVGGVVGGIGGLFILALLLFFCLRRRRKDEFDGNFDPAHVTSGGGGTLPKIDLGEDGIMGDGRGGGGLGAVEEDDGMGGRLGAGAGGGGIITPYHFVPSAPLGGAGVGGAHQYSSPHMQQTGGTADGLGVAAVAGAAGYGNEKRAMRQQQQFGHTSHPSISSGSNYPATMASSANPHQQHVVGSPEPSSPTSDGFSSVGGRSSSIGAGVGGMYYGPQTMGRGPSPGHSMLSSSSGGGRNAKEMEAMGGVMIANPDDGAVTGSGGGQPLPGFQQAYLQSGPGPHHQQRPYSSSSSSTPVPSHLQQHSPTPSSAGTAVVVHEDGGRVVMRKGGGEGEGEVMGSEIPPTYDSLPVDVRRDS